MFERMIHKTAWGERSQVLAAGVVIEEVMGEIPRGEGEDVGARGQIERREKPNETFVMLYTRIGEMTGRRCKWIKEQNKHLKVR